MPVAIICKLLLEQRICGLRDNVDVAYASIYFPCFGLVPNVAADNTDKKV
jgi:hypothetical protein